MVRKIQTHSSILPSRGALLALTIMTLGPLLAACAAAPSDPDAKAAYERKNDPVEPANRDMLAVNQFVDKYTLKPVAKTYRDNVPELMQEGVHNFLTNLSAPMIEVNDLLQGNFGRGWITLQRFVLNTLVGGLGLVDVAAGNNLPFHDADFGQTFGVWGIGEGPYVMLPVFGPSNVRDAIGTGLSFVADPWTFVGGVNALYATYARTGADAVDERSEYIDSLDEMQATSIDFYASLRSSYRQHRSYEVREAGGNADATDPIASSVTVGQPELSSP
jgi:phospholipid-binding lipoprotein MlaA